MKVLVPKGMLAAAAKASGRRDDLEGHFIYASLEAALRWLSENPIVPSEDEMVDMRNRCSTRVVLKDPEGNAPLAKQERELITAWQRRMFLAPEPEIPEAIEDMLVDLDLSPEIHLSRSEYNYSIIEAYRRGKEKQDIMPGHVESTLGGGKC